MKEPRPVTRAVFIDSSIIFLLACLLILPLFRLENLNNWASIESTFIADSRMLREHLPHPGWQRFWYCGTRFDYIYPPALRYGTALISLLAGVSTARAYHVYTALFYALGISGMYWLVHAGSRSRMQAWLAAAATALLSPALAVMPALGRDSPDWVPQRLHVLMSYGEGPHISALSVLAPALAASLIALRGWKPPYLIAAGALCAAVVATNFYGATALAIFFPILVWAVFLEVRRRDVWLRAAAIAGIAYGLCAFWFTPSYVQITRLNLHWVAVPASRWSGVIWAAAIIAFCAITSRISLRAWTIFVWGAAIFMSGYVLGAYYVKFAVAGNALRLAPELDAALILLSIWIISVAWKTAMLRSGIIVLCCTLYFPAAHYVRRAWSIFPSAIAIQDRCEFDISRWMHTNLPGVRALPSGSIRFWYDAWFDNSEAYGGSNQGMLNQNAIVANWEITQGTDSGPAVQWLQALGVDAVIVPDRNSQEVYHDYAHPEKFQNVLQPIYDDRKGNIIYRVPRRFPVLARVINSASLSGVTVETLPRYVAAVEQGPDSPVTLKWSGSDTLDLAATTAPGQSLLVQETFDPAWHAYAGTQPVRITQDPIGFMLLDTAPGTHTIHMQFETPLENRIGQLLTILTCASILVLLFRRALPLRRRPR